MNAKQIGFIVVGTVLSSIVSSICTQHVIGNKMEKILRSNEELWERFLEACPNAK